MDSLVPLEVHDLTKDFGRHHAVRGVSFRAEEAEFLTLLGPSGSGKTTTLRMVAGFTQPTSGRIVLAGEDVTRLPPERRDIGMVFQSYALFPHLSAARNIAFPLEMRRVPRDEIQRRVGEALALVRLDGLGDRLPRQLSGGQQQRVALARAVVYQPRLLLMDEPLGALDRKLREAMQVEILRIRREIGLSVIYVTHDQDEALSMSDRIAIFNEGRIVQMGSARELYRRPATRFVADFLGEATIIAGTITSRGGQLRLAVGDVDLGLPTHAVDTDWLAVGIPAALVVRAESARLSAERPATGESISVTVEEILYLGATTKVVVRLQDESRGVVRRPIDEGVEHVAPGNQLWMAWAVDDAVVVPDRPATNPPPPPGS